MLSGVSASVAAAMPCTVTSDIDLGRGILPFVATGRGGIEIERGDVPADLGGEGEDGVTYQIRDRRVLIRVPNGPRYLIERGQRIIYASDPDVGERETVLFLLGSAWPALCCQRGLIPIRASAVEYEGRIFGFSGGSSKGKSMLVAALAAGEIGFFTDEVLMIDPKNPGQAPLCLAGVTLPKLWGGALELAGVRALEPVRSVDGFNRFYADPFTRSSAATDHLRTIVMLEEARHDEAFSMTPLKGAADVITSLISSVFRPRFSTAILGKKALQLGLASLSTRIAMWRLVRRHDSSVFADDIERLKRWIHSTVDA